MSEWKILSDLVERKICYGIVQPGNKGGSVPIIKVNNIIAGLNTLEDLETTTEEIASKYERTKLKGGELIISLVGTVGVTAIVPHTFAGCNLVRATGMIDIEDEILARYVKYFLETKSAKEYLYGRLNTTVQPTLNVKTLENLPIPIINRQIMNTIVSILSVLDDKIAVNRRICENLEAQAQALFKHWFIDFAPFKEGKFVESELGMIPEGWRVGGLFDIAEVHDSKRKPLSGMQRAKMKKIFPYYGATEQMDMVDDYIFDGRYVLMGEDGSVVRDNGLPFIQYVWGKIWVNNHAHVLSGKNGFTTEMLIPFLTKYNIRGLVTGAVQAKLNQANMAKISLAIPPKFILDNISGLFETLYDTYRQCVTEIRTLSTLRDTLLPKLMSGQIKV